MTKIRLHIFSFLLLTLFLSCSQTETASVDAAQKEIFSQKLCHLDNCINVPADELTETDLLIEAPAAVAFFSLYEAIVKYDGKFPDSLPEVVRSPGRQELYYTIDQRGMYDALIKPILDSMKVTAITLPANKKAICFYKKKQLKRIPVEQFKERDGVLLLAPEKIPLVWRNDRRSEDCKDEIKAIKKYFLEKD